MATVCPLSNCSSLQKKTKKSTYFSVNQMAVIIIIIIIIIPFGKLSVSSSATGLLKYDVSKNVGCSVLDSDTM
jgi:hypothetical protein